MKKKHNDYEEIIQWLETHDGRYPKGHIIREGRQLKKKEMSPKEKEETRLYGRWHHSQEYRGYKACKGIPLESLPTEYEQYREQIATLRRYEQIKKEKAVEKRMRKSVARQVQSNASTRSELLEVVRQLEMHISELSGVVEQLKEDILEIS